MKKLCIVVLLAGLVLGGYNCNRSPEKTSEGLGIEDSESALDPMEKEIFEEGEETENLNAEDSGGDLDQPM